MLTVTREREPILPTAAMAQVPDLACLTLGGERIALVLAEFVLLGRGHERQHVCLVNVAEPITRLNKVIARVQIAGVFQRRAVAAGRRMHA